MQKLSHNREFRFCDEPGSRHQIGKGGFGIVYRGVHISSGTTIAVKKIRLNTGMHRERVRAEIEHSKACSGHPHVIELMHSEITNRHGYLFFGYCKGGTVGELVRSLGPRPEDFARTILVQLLNALEYVHSLGIVHRDVKPGNAFLDEPECDPRKVHVRLGDFGLARKHTPDRDPQAALMQTFCGSPMFMAPEILTRQTYGRDVDYFGLGAVVFFVVTGTPPYKSRRLEQLIEDVKLKKVKRPKYPDAVSESARDVIDRMLVADPGKRIDPGSIVEHPFITQIEPPPPPTPPPSAAAAPGEEMSFVVVDRRYVDVNEATVPIWRRDSPEAAERLELYEAYNRAVLANLHSPYRAMVVIHRLLGMLRTSVDFFKDNAGGNQMAAFQRMYNGTVIQVEAIRDQARRCAAFGVQPPPSNQLPSAEEVIYMHAVRIAADGATNERNQDHGVAGPLYKDCVLLLRNLRKTADEIEETTVEDLVRLDDLIAQSLRRLSVVESTIDVRCRRCGGEMLAHHNYCAQCGLHKRGVKNASLTSDTVLDMSSLE